MCARLYTSGQPPPSIICWGALIHVDEKQRRTDFGVLIPREINTVGGKVNKGGSATLRVARRETKSCYFTTPHCTVYYPALVVLIPTGFVILVTAEVVMQRRFSRMYTSHNPG